MKKLLLSIGIPLVFIFLIRGVFGVRDWQDFYSVMSITFLFLTPAAVGALTIFFSSTRLVESRSYQFFMPWVPIMLFFLLTLFFKVEGLACWVMILPVFLIASSIGGLVAGYFKLKKKDDTLPVSLLAVLPLFLSPLEQAIGKIPGQYQAFTQIDIRAPNAKIWSNVTRVRTIEPSQDHAWFTRALGFPRPIKAELDFEGVGASRKAIFDHGLVFEETVIAYQHQQHMTFSIKADPYDIPSTTMDEHIVIGGEYFDVLKGTYTLELLNDSTYCLHLSSQFKLTTTFNFYASWWAKWIMEDIQNNILEVIKNRSENE